MFGRVNCCVPFDGIYAQCRIFIMTDSSRGLGCKTMVTVAYKIPSDYNCRVKRKIGYKITGKSA